MKKFSNKNNLKYLGALLILGSLVWAVTTFASPSLFETTDNFVLLAENKVTLESDVQISSGDIGSNNKLDIDKDNIVNGNLFADEIKIEKDSTINGNTTYNKLKIKEGAQILGIQTDSIQLPVAQLPATSDFEAGQDKITFEGDNNTLQSGNYKDIKLKQNSTLILQGGTYNLRSLRLEKQSILIFNQPTILNIQHKLTGDSNIAILPGQNLNQNDLQINFLGEHRKDDKKDKDGNEDESDNDDSDKDKDDKKDKDKRKRASFIHFGKNSFLNFKLLAPTAMVRLGKQTTFRGQILADEVHIGKGSVVSRRATFTKTSNPEDIITDPDGGVYPINIILVSLESEATFADAQKVAEEISGNIVGFVRSINLYQIELQTETIGELESVINGLRNRIDLKVEGVYRNYTLPTGT